MSLETRIVELEIRYAQQADLIETLNEVLTDQQKTIDELKQNAERLTRHVRQLRDQLDDQPSGDEPFSGQSV